jgi:hypothetical protein
LALGFDPAPLFRAFQKKLDEDLPNFLEPFRARFLRNSQNRIQLRALGQSRPPFAILECYFGKEPTHGPDEIAKQLQEDSSSVRKEKNVLSYAKKDSHRRSSV